MTYADWIFICLLGIFLAVVVTALHVNNLAIWRRYADKTIHPSNR